MLSFFKVLSLFTHFSFRVILNHRTDCSYCLATRVCFCCVQPRLVVETQAERSERIARANIVPELESQVSAKTELVSFLELFRFANALDWVCIFVAVCASFVTGYAQVLHVHFPPRLHLLTISIFDCVYYSCFRFTWWLRGKGASSCNQLFSIVYSTSVVSRQ